MKHKKKKRERPDTPKFHYRTTKTLYRILTPKRIGIETREDEWNRFWWQTERERERGGCFWIPSPAGEERWSTKQVRYVVALCYCFAMLCIRLIHAPPTRVLNNLSIACRGLSELPAPACNFENFYMNWILRFLLIKL